MGLDVSRQLAGEVARVASSQYCIRSGKADGVVVGVELVGLPGIGVAIGSGRLGVDNEAIHVRSGGLCLPQAPHPR